MDITIEQLMQNSYVISINDVILNRFNTIFTNAGFNILPKKVYGFKFNESQFKVDKLLKKLYDGKKTSNINYGALGCGISHAFLVKYAMMLGLDFICIFEDDAYPCNDILLKLQQALTNIPNDCDILKLGWSRIYNGKTLLNNKFNADPRSYGTFAYIIFKKYYELYFKNFEHSYISDHIVMNNSNVKLYHVQQKLFSYYNTKTDKPLHSFGNLKNDGKTFTMQYITNNKTNFNIIQPTDELKNLITNIQPFIYRANGGNTGDIIIALAETQLFKNLHLDYVMVNAKNKKQLIDKPFNLVYGGGGGWVDLYNNNCKQQLQTYFLNKNLKQAIILPSTFYRCDNIIKSFDERFIVFCRDKVSLEYCISLNTKAKFILHNDMAFSADFSQFNLDNLNDINVNDAKQIMQKMHNYRIKNASQQANFIRTDKEKTIDANILGIENFDLSLIKGLYGENITLNDIYQYSKLFLYMIDKYQTIYTNRLHVAICSYKLNKNIICYDNSYGKVFNTLKYTIPNYKKIEFRN